MQKTLLERKTNELNHETLSYTNNMPLRKLSRINETQETGQRLNGVKKELPNDYLNSSN